ncbi:hypothetical protein CHGG_04894 [Chaetomium globosum CBS 148.51]|uniref:Glycoside hydrolase family 93 protein n=1 Tax=Chaetomium globosum (strain ATCC 6205 / CBS 148.51 / DSM 1962 / NBRC 6347 / NRRL 1970) TaxID=306901 RepID=Q2H002_CHAGB|nr:uncharacterized protein CHGG_04894 [Chaetomium globosum CBS 148.51]EAQ88275.1 hypothetical protein CHGG_04894 [Chaetomium globosum CBS 148.51]
MKWSTLVVSLLPLVSAAPKKHKTPETFTERVVFTPPDNYTDPRVLYARTAQFEDGTLLATWENYSPEPPPVYFPIFRSTDGGYSWKEISRVQDTANGLGLRYQPFLYILDEPFGDFPKDTVLLAGSSIPTDLSSTQIDLYASTNRGRTWTFVSHIAAGGEAIPNNDKTPVWEPFLFRHGPTLICFYSDQRQNTTYGQKMVHQTTTDLRTWGPVTDDVTSPIYTDRPGMPTVATLPNNKLIMTYEHGGSAVLPGYQFPVHYKLTSDPEAFGAAAGVPLRTADGYVPTGSPYVVWSAAGGANGTIIAGAHSSGEVFVNTGLGEPGSEWRRVGTGAGNAYTRHLRVLKGAPPRLLIMGAGQLPPSTTNRVLVSVLDIGDW